LALVIITGLVGATYSVSNETTSISGQVTDSNGNHIFGALIVIRSSNGIEYAISDDSGQYVVNNIPIFEEIKISCYKTNYKIFHTSFYINMVGVCPIIDIELQNKNNNYCREFSISL
jgi:hypothetical protein